MFFESVTAPEYAAHNRGHIHDEVRPFKGASPPGSVHQNHELMQGVVLNIMEAMPYLNQ